MGIFEQLQRKTSTHATRATPTSRQLRPSRSFTPSPMPTGEQFTPDRPTPSKQSSRLRYSLAGMPIFPPERKSTTGLPDTLKAGIENFSGLPLDDVQVHYNSDKPAQVQASAYTQGATIHVGPGQEKHLPHEAWHVVQQLQRRVKPTMQEKGVPINDEKELEREASVMGAKGERTDPSEHEAQLQRDLRPLSGQTQSAAVTSARLTTGQPVMQLMKLSQVKQADKFERVRKGGRVLNLQGYHVTVYANQKTWKIFPNMGNPHGAQPSNDEFEFDELHLTPGAGHSKEHFFYKADGTPLERPELEYAGNARSVAWDDLRWYDTNNIVANLLGLDANEIDKHWSVEAQGMHPATGETKPFVGKETSIEKKVELSPELQKQIAVAQMGRKMVVPRQQTAPGGMSKKPAITFGKISSPSLIETSTQSQSIETFPIETPATPQSEETPRSLEEQQGLKRKGGLSTGEKGAKEQKTEEEEEAFLT